jgi:hypothetical protein
MMTGQVLPAVGCFQMLKVLGHQDFLETLPTARKTGYQ